MIPFFKTTLGQEEKKSISDVIDSGWIVQGPKTQEFEEQFAAYVGSRYAVFVDSGTAALFLSLMFQRQFDSTLTYVYTPSLTFVSDPEAIIHAGLTPQFCDVDPKTFCMIDPPEIKKNAMFMPVHLTGNRSLVKGEIYDSAHRIELNDFRKDSAALWCYSFYATKNMSTINGGMICTDLPEADIWLRKARDHGLSKGTRERYTDKTPIYDVEFIGYRLKADDVRAAVGIEQLKKLPTMTARRNEIITRYNTNLGQDRTGNHLYPILVSDRDTFFESMRAAQIQCSIHFLPLHKMTPFKPYAQIPLPNTEYIGAHIVSLPLFPAMTDKEVDYVSQKVLDTGLMINA